MAEYDFQRPLFRVAGRAASPGATLVAPATALPTSLGGLASAAMGALAYAGIPAQALPHLEHYEHHGEDEQPDFDQRKAQVALDQINRRALVQGNLLDAIAGDADVRVSKDRQMRIEGKDKRIVTGEREEEMQSARKLGRLSEQYGTISGVSR